MLTLAVSCAATGFSLAPTSQHPIAQRTPRAPIRLRGGAASASLANYAAEAAGLFGNMGGASAFLAGGLVPLSTFAAPKPGKDDTPLQRKLARLHAIVSSTSLVSLMISVMYATITSNKLREAAVASTTSLKALLVEGDYALPWIGCNAHFILGLNGLATTIGINVWLSYGGAVGKAVSCVVTSALIMMLSIVNDAIAVKGPSGVSVGGSVLSLLAKYVSLLVGSVVSGRRVMVLISLGFLIAGGVFAAKCALTDEE